MSEFTTVAKVGEIPTGGARAFSLGDAMVAIFHRSGDEYFAIDDFCPHMGASLAEGTVEGTVVTCPWHAWRYDICNGTWKDNPRGPGVASYEVRVSGDEIQVREKGPPTAEA
ncbi:MAG: Rieske (2Fe-2S) protein [Pirellulales bacterium]|nr:Rieske (2Fe-2S) protein [Pirellulales bacterium]